MTNNQILNLLFKEKRHQKNCCTEVLLPLSSSEGVCVDFTLEMKFMFHFSSSLLKHSSCPVHGRGAGSGWCLLWKDASQQGQTGELAIWWQVYCFVNGVGNMVSSLMFIAHSMSYSYQFLRIVSCFSLNWTQVRWRPIETLSFFKRTFPLPISEALLVKVKVIT